MKTVSFLTLFLVVSLSSTSWGLIVEPSFEGSVWYANAVVIAKPLELKKIKVSDRTTYELGTFQLTRSLVGGGGSTHFGPKESKEMRFHFLRLYRSQMSHFEKFDFQIGKEYILLLLRTEPLCYTPVSNHHPFLEATDENIKKIRKALFGKEEERFAADGMAVEDAIKHADKAISGIEKELKLLLRRGREKYKPKERFDAVYSRVQPHHVFRHLENDKRTLIAQVFPSLFVYSPLNNHDNAGDLEWPSPAENDKMASVEASPSQFFLMKHFRHNRMNLGRVLVGKRTFSIRDEEFEITVFIKLDAGLVGDPTLGRED